MFEERRAEAPEEPQRASNRRLHELTGIPIDAVAAGRILTRSGRLVFDPPLEMAGMVPACWEDRK